MVELNEASAGQPVKTHVGQRLRVTCPNKTTGYRWQVVGDSAPNSLPRKRPGNTKRFRPAGCRWRESLDICRKDRGPV